MAAWRVGWFLEGMIAMSSVRRRKGSWIGGRSSLVWIQVGAGERGQIVLAAITPIHRLTYWYVLRSTNIATISLFSFYFKILITPYSYVNKPMAGPPEVVRIQGKGQLIDLPCAGYGGGEKKEKKPHNDFIYCTYHPGPHEAGLEKEKKKCCFTYSQVAKKTYLPFTYLSTQPRRYTSPSKLLSNPIISIYRGTVIIRIFNFSSYIHKYGVSTQH